MADTEATSSPSSEGKAAINGEPNQNNDNQATHDLLSLYQRCLDGVEVMSEVSSDSEMSEFDMTELDEETFEGRAGDRGSRSRKSRASLSRKSLPFQFFDKQNKNRRTTFHEVGHLLKNLYSDGNETTMMVEKEQHDVDIPYDVSKMDPETLADTLLKEQAELEEMEKVYHAKMVQSAENDMNNLIAFLTREAGDLSKPRPLDLENPVESDEKVKAVMNKVNDFMSEFNESAARIKTKLRVIGDKLQAVELLNSVQ